MTMSGTVVVLPWTRGSGTVIEITGRVVGRRMITVDRWSGRETRLLRHALRLTVRDFAEDLGVSPRIFSKWEAGGAAHEPRPELQRALDTTLARASEEERSLFRRGRYADSSRSWKRSFWVVDAGQTISTGDGRTPSATLDGSSRCRGRICCTGCSFRRLVGDEQLGAGGRGHAVVGDQAPGR
jgi:transcriptional regulator with XRE-family HTH domain